MRSLFGRRKTNKPLPALRHSVSDRLYLLRPNFDNNGSGPFFCAECAVVEGMLSFYPALRNKVDVTYVEFKRPRPEIVTELGPEHQSSPVLVLESPSPLAPATVKIQESNGRKFINNEYEICNYLAAVHRVGQPHR